MAVSAGMNFFSLQDLAKRDSLVLLGAFAAAMLGFAGIITAVLAAVVPVTYSLGGYFNPKGIQLFLIGSVWAYILYKCYARYKLINQGGDEPAIAFGATLSEQEVTTGQEYLLHNINAEMAVASTQAAMKCYVM